MRSARRWLGVFVLTLAVSIGAVGLPSVASGANFMYTKATSITIATNATTSKIGGIPILSGTVTPVGLVGKVIVVYVRKPGKSYWSYSSNRVVYDRYGVPSWQYKYYFKGGMAKGIYTYKAFVPDYGDMLASTSPMTVAITVK
jgi:hypothetical protein